MRLRINIFLKKRWLSAVASSMEFDLLSLLFLSTEHMASAGSGKEGLIEAKKLFVL